jgi:hypothetical protein
MRVPLMDAVDAHALLTTQIGVRSWEWSSNVGSLAHSVRLLRPVTQQVHAAIANYDRTATGAGLSLPLMSAI